ARACSPRGSAAGCTGAASRSPRSRRRTCPTTPRSWSARTVAAAKWGAPRGARAAAWGLAPDLRSTPVLLKPGSDLSSQVVLLGEAVDTVTAGNYRALPPRLGGTAFAPAAGLGGGRHP